MSITTKNTLSIGRRILISPVPVVRKNKRIYIPQKETKEENSNQSTILNQKTNWQTNKITAKCEKKKSTNKHKLALRNLEKCFPKVFNLAFPKPLSIGIREELMAQNKEISNKQIRLGLFFYCNSHQYLRCVKEGTFRVNATGRYVKKVTRSEEVESNAKLRALFTKIKSKK